MSQAEARGFLASLKTVWRDDVLVLERPAIGEILRSPVFRFICLFALTPLAIQVVDSYSGILNGLAVWSGIFWAVLLFRLFADRELRFELAVATLLATAFVMMPLFELYLAMPPHLTERAIDSGLLPVRFLGYVLGVGVREEMCKAIPVMLLAWFTASARRPLNGLVLGMMAGIGFAVSENVYYVYKTLGQAIESTQRTGQLSVLIVPIYNNVVRMMTGPFGHSVYSGIFGYFIALAASDRERRLPLLLTGLGLAALLHGSYNTFVGVSPLWGVAMKAFNFFVLMIYFLKARGLGSALAIGAGLFQRTVVREMPEEVRRAAAPRPAAATPPTPAPPPAPAETLADVPTVVEAAPLADLDATIVEPAASPWRLRRGDGSGSVALSGETLLGRDKARCQVVVEEGAVSRVHARLTPDPGSGRWRIEKLSATGGLWVNDAPVETALLAPGDRIQAGTAVFVMERSG